MDTSTIYSKTSKGMTELKNGCKNLSRDAARVLSMINGRSSVRDFLALGGMHLDKIVSELDALTKLGLVRVFGGAQQSLPAAQQRVAAHDDGLDFSETLPTLEVTELSPQESVEAWAQARRGAKELKNTGFYSYGNKAQLGASKHALTALVVEDDEELSELLVVLLSEKGFTVHTAGDMNDALEVVHTAMAPDLVLLDIVLPGLPGTDGFDLLSAIRRNPGWAKAPVVMVTSEVSDDQVMKGLKAGADAYIFKPFEWETLYSCIQSVVGI
ncbi:response regulator [Massilia atriviolacea]|uniref:Response regulator n=1 Tax=Massilia atriviolacea TaxID=2495579 RepID=A0A430HKX8_9BURK|nr:response regulator [Massilia atriviolacea]RSZ58152.1 response regulator [Massilia atriviolacea]